MAKITSINEKDLDKKFKLCFISPVCLKIEGQIFNKDYVDLMLFFAKDSTDLKVTGSRYCRFYEPPQIDRDFQIIVIKDFITVDIDGTEFRSYQKDSWVTADFLYRESHSINTEKINHGAGCWLYNTDKNIPINANNNIEQVRKIFKKYQLEFYKIEPTFKENE